VYGGVTEFGFASLREDFVFPGTGIDKNRLGTASAQDEPGSATPNQPYNRVRKRTLAGREFSWLTNL
jgi:hypothetical protein